MMQRRRELSARRLRSKPVNGKLTMQGIKALEMRWVP
jgi:hypothetical protein